MKRQSYTFKIDEKLLVKLKKEAHLTNRSFNNYVENLLITHPDRKT